jgi:hypothetical protein
VKIYQISSQVEKLIDRYKYNKEQKYLNKYANIHGYIGNSNEEIYNARKVLANYAKDKGVSIDVYAAGSQKTAEEIMQSKKQNQLDNYVSVIVKSLTTGKSTSRIIDVDANKIHDFKRNIGYSYIEDPADGIEQVRIFKGQYEDNFLRHLYREVSDMVNTHLKKSK